ncbi:MAG: signal recognition particle protein Srp19 [Crenarchaeota archaeon]|nr:signal recognition particle protein Srp19 [Thermoproteota archaeon]
MTLRKYKGKKVILWPQYFDATLSRREGRRVPKSLAVPHPTQRELLDALASLGLSAEPLEARYPREWWNKEGPVLVEKERPKTDLLRTVGEELRKKRYGVSD